MLLLLLKLKTRTWCQISTWLVVVVLAWSRSLVLSLIDLHLILGILLYKKHVLLLGCSHLLLAILLNQHGRVNMLLLRYLLLVHLKVLMALSRRLNNRICPLRRRNLEVVWLSKTLIGHLCECAEPEILVSLLKLAIMALCPNQWEIASSMLSTILTIWCPIDHLGIVIIPLCVDLMTQVLLVNRRIISHYLRAVVSLKALYVLVMSWSHYSLFRILGRYIVVLVPLSRSDSSSLVLVH